MSAYGAHNQRGLVTYSVRCASRPVWIEDLIDLVESCASCSLYSVLKLLCIRLRSFVVLVR